MVTAVVATVVAAAEVAVTPVAAGCQNTPLCTGDLEDTVMAMVTADQQAQLKELADSMSG